MDWTEQEAGTGGGKDLHCMSPSETGIELGQVDRQFPELSSKGGVVMS